MNKIRLIGIIVAMIVIWLLTILAVAKADAKIGEHYTTVVKDARMDRDTISINWSDQKGVPMLVVNYRDGATIEHLFGADNREICFWLFAPKRLAPDDLRKIQRIFHTTWKYIGNSDNGVRCWISSNGLSMGAKRHPDFDYVCIYALSRESEIPAMNPTAATPVPRIEPKSIVPSGSNDCLIIATEAISRLRTTAYWARIASFHVTKNRNEVGGHAVVFFQPTESSNVFMYDKAGSQDLGTKSHDLTDLTSAFSKLLADGYLAQSVKWIGDY